MPGHKRKSEATQDGRRKSARLSARPTRLGFEEGEKHTPSTPVRRSLPEQPMLENSYLSLGGIENSIIEYNEMLGFVSDWQAYCFRGRNSSVRRSIEAIQRTWDQAVEKMNKEYSYIQTCQHALEQGVMSTPYWFEGGDLMALDIDAMDRILKLDHAGPAHRFDSYIRSVALKAVERIRCETGYKHHYDLVDKIIRLLNKLVEVPTCRDPFSGSGRYLALHTVVFLRSRVMRSDLCSYSQDLEEGMKKFDRIINDCLKKKSDADDGTSKAPQQPSYNCAAARRELWPSMTGLDCSQEQLNSDSSCPHKRNIDLLETLQKRAQEEIHSNVMLATGKHLPAELAELVFEATLEAEEIPLDWKARTPRGSRTDFPKSYWLLKAEYSCPVMESCQRKAFPPMDFPVGFFENECTRDSKGFY